MFLQNRIAAITGGGSGIGKAVAELFAQEGASVAVLDISLEHAQKVVQGILSAGRRAIALRVDITDRDDVKAALSAVYDELGSLDILVNCAGILHTKQIEDITVDDWDTMMSVNLKGTFLMNQSVLPYMEQKGYGRIINFASNSGRDGGISCGLDYAASKAGVIGFTRGLAKRVASTGITCNCIAPGTTQSDMLANFSAEQLFEARKHIPVGKLGSPEHIARLACFVASDEAEFMTGAVLDMNGGMFIG